MIQRTRGERQGAAAYAAVEEHGGVYAVGAPFRLQVLGLAAGAWFALPDVTTVYYAVADGLDGGDLIGYRYHRPRSLTEEFRIAPKTNAIVALSGEHIHGVGPLRSGHRLSVVTNLFLRP